MGQEALYKEFNKEISNYPSEKYSYSSYTGNEAYSLERKEALDSLLLSIEGLVEDFLKEKLDEIANKVLDAEREKLLNIIKSSFDQAIESSEELFKFIEDKSFKCYSIYLKMDDPKTITSLILVDEKDWLDERFDSVYDLSEKLEDAQADINHSFIIMPRTDNFNESSVYSDGYKIKRNDG